MTEDIGMDRNPRAIPARAAARAGVVAGIVMVLVAAAAIVFDVMAPVRLTLGQDVPVWLVAVEVALAGVVFVASSVILRRRVRDRDRNRLAVQNRQV